MDWSPLGRPLSDVKCAAEALDLPWDHITLNRFQLIETIWLKAEYDRIERKRKQQESKKH